MFKCKCLPKSSFEDFLSAVGAEPRNPFLTTLLKYFALIRSPLAKHTCRNRESINANIVEERNVSQRSYLNGREVEVENNPNTKWRVVVGQREHQKGILSSKIWVPENIDCGTKKPVQPLGFVGFLTCNATKPHGLNPPNHCSKFEPEIMKTSQFWTLRKHFSCQNSFWSQQHQPVL